MMIELIKYENLKLWKKMRIYYLVFILVEIAILIITRFILPESPLQSNFLAQDSSIEFSFSFGLLLTFIYYMSSIFITTVPIAESCSRFSNDLSGKQSSLELLLPPLTWKKIVSKLIVSLFHTIFCVLLGLVFSALFFFINLNVYMTLFIDFFNQLLVWSPIEYFLGFIGSCFSLISFTIIIYFCIALSKSLTHKNKISTPIGIFIFAAIVTGISFIAFQAEKFPIYQYTLLGTENELSTMLLDIIIFLFAFWGTSWLIDNKIEN